MTVVLDASAVLAFVQDEPGAAEVEARIDAGAVVGAANWSEVAQRVRAAGRDWSLVRALLVSYPLEIAPVTEADAERAAGLWRRSAGLSLGDRLCQALGDRLDAEVWTADAAWGTGGRIRQIR